MPFQSSRLAAVVDADIRPFETGMSRAVALARRAGQQIGQAGTSGAQGLQSMSKAATGLESGFRALGAAVALGGIAQVGADAVKGAADLQKAEATIRALSGSTERYAQVLDVARRGQSLYGGTMAENLRGLGSLVNASNRYGVELQKLDNIMRRLAGIDGAIILKPRVVWLW